MLRSCLILAAVLPLMLCGEAKGAKAPEGAVAYAAYHSEWGEQLKPLVAGRIHLELTRQRLNVSLYEGMPPLVYTGPVDSKTFDEIVGILRSMDPDSWPGSTGGEDKGTRRKDRCEWSLNMAVREPTYQQMRVYGSDSGRDTPRLEAERRLCGYLGKKLPELHASLPKTLQKLSFSDRPSGAYLSVHVDDGREEVFVSVKGLPSAEFYVEPGLLQDMRALLDKYGAETWHGFGYGKYENGKMPICFEAEYSSRQPLLVHAGQDDMPKGFAEFCRDLRARLEPLARRWREAGTVPAGGIKRFHFGESGMRMAPHYEFYRRLDAGGVEAHLMRTWGSEPDGDVALSAADEQELAGILAGLASWNGFKGRARGVLDGPGFGLSAEFADGRRIEASGYAKFPNGYREGRDRLMGFIEKRLPASARERHER
ncbi:MAG: hypothetical protein K6E40_11660 [Desulfovibrio sp.]|nr:hypothetical protein [Desulfovibrio sp.]